MYVYAYHNTNNEVIYVGSSKNAVNRFQTHRKQDTWMTEVDAITIWGPYHDTDEGALCEKALVSALNPRYNTNLTTYSVDAPILHQEGLRFQSLSDMKKFFKNHPNESSRYTFCLPNDEIEALRLLSFYSDENISDLASAILRKGIQEMAAQLGHPNIFEEARGRLRKK